MSSPLLAEAVGLHQRGRLAEAKTLYQRVLAADPGQPDALHLLGVIARQQGDPAQAVDLITQAIQAKPGQANQHCNLGAALQDLGRADEALGHYDRAVQLDPSYALAYSNRGNPLRHLGRLDEALASYERALALKAAYPEAWCNRAIALNDLGRFDEAVASAERALQLRASYADAWMARANGLQGQGRFTEALDSYERALALKDDGELHTSRGTALQRLQRFEEALAAYDRAIALRPAHPLAHHYRANTLRALGRSEEALTAYRQALELGGDRAQIEFALAALGAAETPQSTPSDYVRSLFDQYAGHFDQHLVEGLAYGTPAHIDAALAPHVIEAADVLDLGCGTGLCAPVLRPRASRLTGVDLSPRMLDKARARGLYDELACADIADWLHASAATFGLVVAADVLVYIGDLARVFDGVQRVLAPQGLFCFSVEAGEGADYVLAPSQRYRHTLAYIERLARQRGLTLLEAQTKPLRQEGGSDVAGYIVTLRR